MRRVGFWLCSCLVLIAAASFAEEKLPPGVVVCGKPVCEAWAPKGENTCRSCSITLCKAPEGKELVGNRKHNECYEGHGEPPPDESEE